METDVTNVIAVVIAVNCQRTAKHEYSAAKHPKAVIPYEIVKEPCAVLPLFIGWLNNQHGLETACLLGAKSKTTDSL